MMKSKSVTLAMVREDATFEATFALVQGPLTALSRGLGSLHPEELRLYEGFKYERRQLSYLLGRLAGKQALRALKKGVPAAAIHIDSGVFKFPIVKCAQLPNQQLSISHCNDIGVSLAFAEAHPLGIDLEEISLKKKEIILSQFTDAELAMLEANGLGTMTAYTAVWTIKEALSKVIKTGMMMEFKLMEIDRLTIENGILETTFTHFKQYKARAYFGEKYAMAVALPKKTSVDLSNVWELIKAL